jgi:hypothetical protein
VARLIAYRETLTTELTCPLAGATLPDSLVVTSLDFYDWASRWGDPTSSLPREVSHQKGLTCQNSLTAVTGRLDIGIVSSLQATRPVNLTIKSSKSTTAVAFGGLVLGCRVGVCDCPCVTIYRCPWYPWWSFLLRDDTSARSTIGSSSRWRQKWSLDSCCFAIDFFVLTIVYKLRGSCCFHDRFFLYCCRVLPTCRVVFWHDEFFVPLYDVEAYVARVVSRDRFFCTNNV